MIEVFVPRENVNDDSVIVRAINFNTGALVHKGQVIAQLETSKTIIEIESPADGVIQHNLEPGNEIGIGQLLFSVGAIESKNKKSEVKENISKPKNVQISKMARKRAIELDISIDAFESGWVTVKDIEKKSGMINSISGDDAESSNYFPSENQDRILVAPYFKEKISKRKQAEIRNLQIGNNHVINSTIGIDIKVPANRIVAPPYLFQNSISDLIVYEGSKLLRKYPELNAAYVGPNFIAKYKDVNFGWSFDSGSNLKVLAIKNSDQLSLVDLHLEVERLLELYESNQNIATDLLNSSTVTISDLSNCNATFMLPLINGYQSLILGVVSKAHNHYSIFATFDHRISEGLVVTKFLSEIKDRILSYYFDKDGRANLTCFACEKSITDELSERNRGFIKIMLPTGNEANLCRNCFDGW